MRVLGLLSGGKDSVYSLMCAVRAGHTLVGVAHIAAQHAGTEVDSYMYQTVGSEAAAGVAECLGVPFFAAVRTGDAQTQALEYGAAAVPGDEVETMHALLCAVRDRHGVAFDAVVSGAILSTYQKTRVESVCARLGVASLAPLWQRDQAELLAAMVRDGLVAVLVKVACLGLDARHLGLTLAQAQPHLTKLSAKYGTNVCGEGGEYESLVLDCPLFKKRLVLDETEVVEHVKDPFAPVLYMRIRKWHTEAKAE